MDFEPLDRAIIGGGPAGLNAALYLVRFNRSFALLDAGDSRAAWIPKSHNLPLFTHGIAGWEMLQRQREDVHTYGGTVIDAKKLIRASSDFTVEFQKEGAEPSHLTARVVIFATGVKDIPPLIPASGGALIYGFCLENRSAVLLGSTGPNIGDCRIRDTAQEILSKDLVPQLPVCGTCGQEQS